MEITPNFNLKKPGPNDFVVVQDLNDNSDIIDSVLSKQVSKLNEEYNTDPNTTLAGHILSSHANIPSGNAHCYILTFFYGSISLTSNRMQIAYGYTSNNMYQRRYNGTTWSAWERKLTQADYDVLFQSVSNGKQLIGAAITDADNSLIVPTNPTFQQLADLIGGIVTGKKWATGTIARVTMTTPVTVTGLAFTPKVILMMFGRSNSSSDDLSVSALTSDAYNDGARWVNASNLSSRPSVETEPTGNSFTVTRLGADIENIRWVAIESVI